jgi:hypothetical protein
LKLAAISFKEILDAIFIWHIKSRGHTKTLIFYSSSVFLAAEQLRSFLAKASAAARKA